MRFYEQQGVNYDVLDAAKRGALAAARETSDRLPARGGQVVEASRGEPAFVFSLGARKLVHVLEALGTKSVLTRRYEELTGVQHYDWLARDTVAAVVNDLVCCGARPLVVNAYFATGGDGWYSVEGRSAQLVEGWRQACIEAGAAWGGGESPSLPGLVSEGELELAGSAVGCLPDGLEPILGDDLAPGDAIVLVRSSGLHANGASVARAVEATLPGGLGTPLTDGVPFGEHVLRPSLLYAGLVEALLDAGVEVTYLSHVTGHGLRKLMRANRELTYRVRELPPVPPVLRFLAEQAGMDDREAYGTFNMGAGFAVYCRPGSAERVVELAGAQGLEAMVAGGVEAGPRAVVIEPLAIRFGDEELQLRERRS